MFHFLVDYAWWFYVLLGLAALGLFYLWWVHRKRGFLIALAASLGVIAVIFLLSLFVVTDRMQLRNALLEMADGVTNKNPDKVVKHLAKNFKFDASNRALNKEATRQAIVSSIQSYQIEEVYLWNFEVEKLSRAEGVAHVKFNVRVTAGFDASAMPFLCRSVFVLEDKSWRMKSIEFFNPVANTDKVIRFPIP